MQKATAHLERAFAISEAELGFGRALHDTSMWLKEKAEKVRKHMPPFETIQKTNPDDRFTAVHPKLLSQMEIRKIQLQELIRAQNEDAALKKHAQKKHEGRYVGDLVTESRDPEYLAQMKEWKRQQEEHDRRYLEEMAQNQKADQYPRSGRDPPTRGRT